MGLFGKKSVGLDITDHSIAVVELQRSQGEVVLTSAASGRLQSGIVERGIVKDEDKLKRHLADLFANARPNAVDLDNIVFGLPDSIVYTHTFHIVSDEDKDLDSLIRDEAHGKIPLPNNDLLFSQQILSRDKEGTEVLIVAISKKALEHWQTFFNTAGIEIDIYDIRPLARYRGLRKSELRMPVSVIDIGDVITSVNIFDDNGLLYAQNINAGDEDLTDEAVGKSSNAERLEIVSRQIKEALSFIERKLEERISDIVLIGAGSLTSDITAYLEAQLGRKVRHGRSVVSGGSGGDDRDSLYLKAVGLALRNIDEWYKEEPTLHTAFSPKDEENADRTDKKESFADFSSTAFSDQRHSFLGWIHYYRIEIVLAVILLIGIALTVAGSKI